MNDVRHVSKEYALVGFPLRHSVSPFIHGRLFAIKGMDASYTLCEAEDGSLGEVWESTLQYLGGFNVTIPYKTAIIPYLDTLSSRAALFGAVNTVCFENGKAVGHNTDCEGSLRSLKAAGIPLAGEVLITGCGGVSRMFAFESALAGASVTLAVRESSLEKARRLRGEIRDKLSADARIVLLDEIDKPYDLLINGTPVGMYPHEDACPVSEDAVKRCGAVFDAIYNPLQTKLLQYADAADVPYVNGLPMLVWQAAVAEELWQGVHFGEEEIRQVIAQTERELER